MNKIIPAIALYITLNSFMWYGIKPKNAMLFTLVSTVLLVLAYMWMKDKHNI